jgi:hypothetical protein
VFDGGAYLDELFARCVRGGPEDLHDYQDYAVDWLYENPYSGLFAGTGLGKTTIVYSLLNKLNQLDELPGHVLVSAPIKVANRVWPYEHRLWRHTAYFSTVILRVEDDDPLLKTEFQRVRDRLKAEGNPAALANKLAKQRVSVYKEELRTGLLTSKAKVHIINHEAVDWLVNYYVTNKLPWPYKVVIWDESSKLRDHNSKVFIAINAMRPYIDRIHELTATPAKQSYVYFFSQIYLLDRGERFGKGITAFRERYFTEHRYTRKLSLRPGGAKAIEKKIANITLTLRKEDYSDLQKPIIRIRKVRLPAHIVDKYKEFEQTAILETPDDKVIEAGSAAILNSKLLQLATGAVYDSNREVSFFHEAKFDELEQLLDETLDEPILCAYWFKPTLARLRKRFPEAVVMDKQGKMEAPWNERKYKMMFIHPASAAHGLNLQFGGHHLAVVDLFHSAELFEQLYGRLDRQGQTETVTVHLLAARGTVDNVVARNLQVLEDAQDAMYRRLQRLHRQMRR